MGVKRALKNIDAVLGASLGVSLIIHAMLFGVVTNVELPPPPSQAEYTDWVKKIATPRREGIVLPPPVARTEPQAPAVEKKETVKEESLKGESSEQAASEPTTRMKPKGPASSQGGSQGIGQGSGSKEGLRQRVSRSGVLGVIGVNDGGKGGEFADVFSSNKAVSDDVAKVGSGKQGASPPSESDLGARGVKGGDGGSGVADIGGIGPAAKTNGSAQVKTGSRKEAELKPAKVGGGAAETLSGFVDRKSMANAISKKAGGFRRCYERGLNANPELEGKLVFEITIDVNGKVVEVRFTEDTLRSSEVVDCIRGILMRISFTNADGGLATFKSSLFFEPPR